MTQPVPLVTSPSTTSGRLALMPTLTVWPLTAYWAEPLSCTGPVVWVTLTAPLAPLRP